MSKKRSKKASSTAVVLADIPERQRLRELQRLLGERRDKIAALDLEIETERELLRIFEASFQAETRGHHGELCRIERLVQYYERWVDLLQETPSARLPAEARRIASCRQKEVARSSGAASAAKDESTPAASAARKTPSARLKAAYHALARRYHPDLATCETDRVQYSELMARINALYRSGDVERLEALAEQQKGGDIDAPDLDVQQQLDVLQERLKWFDLVLDNLREERQSLERTPTCELLRNVEQATALGRDLVSEIKDELRRRIDKSYVHVAHAAHMLESEVDSFNRKLLANTELTSRQRESLEQRFDPFADKRIIRLGLDELRDLMVRPEARARATELEPRLIASPAILRLVLLTHIAELSPFALPGLESYDDIALRFMTLSEKDERRVALEEALVLGDDLVEFGVRKPNERLVRVGLRFHDDIMREAVPILLKSLPIRRELKRVLGVLGPHERCEGCARDIFAVPLFRTRGLDDLRALVCPRCGHTLRSYWMPKGKDVQAVLNTAFLDFGLVTEWSFQLGRGSFGTQLLPMQAESMRVFELRDRIHHDLFARYELDLKAEELILTRDGTPLNEQALLAELDDQTIVLRLEEDSALRENEAFELLCHRVKNRFRAS